jgi:fatty acid desaturase
MSPAGESTLDAAREAEPVDEARPSSQLRRYLREESIKLPRDLTGRSVVASVGYLAWAHMWIGLSLLAALYLPGGVPAILAASFVLILLAQRSLQTLVHHLSHDLLSRNRQVNDWIGNLFAAGFIGMRIQNYRRVHFVHHAENGGASDPEFIDFSAVRARGGLWRYVLHFVAMGEALALVRKYYAPRAAGAGAAPKSPLPARLAGLAIVALCQASLVAAFWLAGAPYLYLMWLYVSVTWSPMLSRLRFLVEHPGKDDRTVSTRAPWYEVIFFAPYQFNYHFEHHVWPALPPYRLRSAHQHVAGKGYFERHPEYLASSFVGSLAQRAARE